MKSQINALVAMRDNETLYQLMYENDDEVLQFDAAEALIQLGDKRGLEFLLIAAESEITDVREAAEEILEGPDAQRMREEIEAERRRDHLLKVERAKERLRKGKKVYAYKVVYVPASDILQEDALNNGFNIPDLDEAGLEGWEVVNFLPRCRSLLVGSMDDHFVGVYVLLKREIAPDESATLDEI